MMQKILSHGSLVLNSRTILAESSIQVVRSTMFRKYGGSLRYTKAGVCITRGVCLIWALFDEVFTLYVLSLDVQRNQTMNKTRSDLPFQLPDHIQNNCPRAVVQCPYYYIGCNVEVHTLNFSIFYTFLKHTHIVHSTNSQSFFLPIALVLRSIQFSFVIFHVCYICTYTTTVRKIILLQCIFLFLNKGAKRKG